jgi:hypothetical protein
MATGPTTIRGTQVTDGTIQRVDLDVSTVGLAVIAKVIPKDATITMTSTGADAGTGDVTIGAVIPAPAVPSVFGRTGAITAQSGDYSAFYPLLTGSYSNPSWISALAWGKITGAPAFEPALGNPSTSGYVLSSTTAGARSWINAAGGLSQVTSDTTLSGLGTAASPLAVIAVNGVTDGSNAVVGDVGQTIVQARIQTSGVTMSSSVATNICQISLTAGDWDVRGSVNVVMTSLAVNGVEIGAANISTTSATISTDGYDSQGSASNPSAAVQSFSYSMPLPPRRISLSANTTVYMVGSSGGNASTRRGYGYIEARRVR